MGISKNSNSFTFAATPRFRVHKNPIFLGADKIGFHSSQTLGLLDTPKYHIYCIVPWSYSFSFFAYGVWDLGYKVVDIAFYLVCSAIKFGLNRETLDFWKYS